MAEPHVGLQWRMHIRVELDLATGPNRAPATRGTYWCTWRGLGRTKMATPTTCHGGRSKRVRREGYGVIGTHRAVGGGEGAHHERVGVGSGLGDVVVAPDFLRDAAAAGVGGDDLGPPVTAPASIPSAR